MDFAQVMGALRDAGTEENRKVLKRHGAKREAFGVGLASLDAIAAEIGTDQKLADKLWTSGNADARLLATRLADPTKMTPAKLAQWAHDLEWYVEADALAKLAFHTKAAKKVALDWMGAKHEWTARAGWHTLALITRDKALPDSFFHDYLQRIERGIAKAPNRVRDAMNAALIAIGVRTSELAQLAVAAAKRIGHVRVDYGAAKIKTPNAAQYIKRARAFLEAPPRAVKGAKGATATKVSKSRQAAKKASASPKTAPKTTQKAAARAGRPPARKKPASPSARTKTKKRRK